MWWEWLLNNKRAECRDRVVIRGNHWMDGSKLEAMSVRTSMEAARATERLAGEVEDAAWGGDGNKIAAVGNSTGEEGEVGFFPCNLQGKEEITQPRVLLKREIAEDVVLSGLAKEKTRLVGIFGLRGMGTRLAAQVADRALQTNAFLCPHLNMFQQVLIVGIVEGSFVPTVPELVSVIKGKGSVLIILDEVPEMFDIGKIAVLLREPQCKVVVTSRFERVFVETGATMVFEAEDNDCGGILGIFEGDEELFLNRISRHHLQGQKLIKGPIHSHTKQDVVCDKDLHVQDYMDEKSFCASCYLYCSVLPMKYRFSKDSLISLWMAQGSIELEEYDAVEKVCSHWFDTLLTLGYILVSLSDVFGPMYTLGEKIRNHLLEPKFQKKLDCHTDVTKVEHLSLDRQKVDSIDFGLLKRCIRLQTLIIYCCYASEMKYLPSDLFRQLKALKVLIVSDTNVNVLSCDPIDLKELRYLDISNTPTYGWFLGHLCSLRNLETIKLSGCRNINDLPDGISELSNLRHLICMIRTQLDWMPKEIGKLLKLQTLNAFLVDSCDGRRIGELKHLNKLKGCLRLLNLETVTTKEEAAEAWLCSKHGLKTIEFSWNELKKKNPDEEEILESLQPPLGIQQLTICYYSGRVLPSWMSLPFYDLSRITLHGCGYLNSLPSLGVLPSLKYLSIVKNDELVEIGSAFCRKEPNQHTVAFPKLEELGFELMSKFEKWTGLKNGDFPHLNTFAIMFCPNFIGLPCLSHMKALSRMMIMDCLKLECWPEGVPPPMLKTLGISGCPRLKRPEEGKDWSKGPFSWKLS